MRTMVRPTCVRLEIEPFAADWQRALGALARVHGLRTETSTDPEEVAARIVIHRAADRGDERIESTPCLEIVAAEQTTPAVITFARHPLVPPLFRGRAMRTIAAPSGSDHTAGMEVLASANGQPVWTTTDAGGVRHDRCWIDAAALARADSTVDLLTADRFCALLPVIEWFRAMSRWSEWQQPPLRACFMFDDPNLHGASYGFLRFAELAAEGARHHFHTALAMVPFDCYHASAAAVRIVKQNTATLSLLVHGNNHSRQELAGRPPPDAARAMMGQAMQRIARFESRTGLVVSRVMAPPHGPCSAEMMDAMRHAGFEAIAISSGSVRAGNPAAPWLAGFGATPAAIIAGLQVIPRFALDRNRETRALLAAYLHQPIIAVGHHWDLANGVELLGSTANFVNGLGPVQWTDMGEIARTNYQSCVRGRTMHVRSWGVVSDLSVPEGVDRVRFEWLPSIESRGTIDTKRGQPDENVTELVVPPGTRARFVLGNTPLPAAERAPRTPFTAVARRLLTEARDRAMPYFRGITTPAVNRS